MSAEDTPDDDEESIESSESTDDVRDRLEQGADRAIEQFDESVVDLLSWILDTETRARIYINLRQYPDSTSEEVADTTGLYPSTVREALAELHEEGTVTRQKRESDGAGNNPYEYSAIPPSELVSETVDDVQNQLNDVFNLDCRFGSSTEGETESVTITVTESGEDESAENESAEDRSDE